MDTIFESPSRPESQRSQSNRSSHTSSSTAPNFSRPRPTSSSTKNLRFSEHERDSENTRAIGAFHEPNRDLPDEPRFSSDSERTVTTTSDHSAGSEFAWDGQKGELVSKRPTKFQEQRYSSQTHLPQSSSSSKNQTSSARTRADASSSSSSLSSKKPQIFKRVSFDQHSERLSMASRDSQFEDAASHHTVSEDGDTGSIDSEGKWSSSNYDISGLSEKELRKLEKKGINPALYAEMRAARGKKKLVGPLLGNGFLG